MRVLLAEAQALVREGLKRVTLQILGTCEFVEATDREAALDVVIGASPCDAAWFDAALFALDEIAVLRRDQPRLLLLALVAHRNDAASMRLFAAGVNAVVPRSASTEILAAAMRLATDGDVCVRGNSLAGLPLAFADRTAPDSRRGSGPLNLTSRQYDVLCLVAQGHSNKAIAVTLGIGLRTVKGHVSVILRALRSDNRADAGRAARRWLARAASPMQSPRPQEGATTAGFQARR